MKTTLKFKIKTKEITVFIPFKRDEIRCEGCFKKKFSATWGYSDIYNTHENKTDVVHRWYGIGNTGIMFRTETTHERN